MEYCERQALSGLKYQRTQLPYCSYSTRTLRRDGRVHRSVGPYPTKAELCRHCRRFSSRTRCGSCLIAGRFDDLQHHPARRECWHIGINDDAKRVTLTFLDQFCRHMHLFWCDVVGRTDPVIFAPFGWLSLYRLGGGADVYKRCHDRGGQCKSLHRRILPESWLSRDSFLYFAASLESFAGIFGGHKFPRKLECTKI